jgi:hypothetical protein
MSGKAPAANKFLPDSTVLHPRIQNSSTCFQLSSVINKGLFTCHFHLCNNVFFNCTGYVALNSMVSHEMMNWKGYVKKWS